MNPAELIAERDKLRATVREQNTTITELRQHLADARAQLARDTQTIQRLANPDLAQRHEHD